MVALASPDPQKNPKKNSFNKKLRQKIEILSYIQSNQKYHYNQLNLLIYLPKTKH